MTADGEKADAGEGALLPSGPAEVVVAPARPCAEDLDHKYWFTVGAWMGDDPDHYSFAETLCCAPTGVWRCGVCERTDVDPGYTTPPTSCTTVCPLYCCFGWPLGFFFCWLPVATVYGASYAASGCNEVHCAARFCLLGPCLSSTCADWIPAGGVGFGDADFSGHA